MKTLPNNQRPVRLGQLSILQEPTFRNEAPVQFGYPRNRRRNTGRVSRVIIDLLFVGTIGLLGSCAWIQSRKTQLTAVGEVALSHIAKDAYAIGLAAAKDEVASGFSTNLAYSLQQNAREQLSYILSSENLSDYLKAWNTSETDSLASLVPKGLDAPSAQRVALVIVDSQAAAIPAAGQPQILSQK